MSYYNYRKEKRKDIKIMQKFYTLQDSNVIYYPQEGLTGTKCAYNKYENLGFDQDQHLLLRNYVGENQYGEMTGITRTEIVGIVDNNWVRKHYWTRPFYYGRPVVWKNDEMDALDFLQKESDRKAKEQREKIYGKKKKQEATYD